MFVSIVETELQLEEAFTLKPLTTSRPTRYSYSISRTGIVLTTSRTGHRERKSQCVWLSCAESKGTAGRLQSFTLHIRTTRELKGSAKVHSFVYSTQSHLGPPGASCARAPQFIAFAIHVPDRANLSFRTPSMHPPHSPCTNPNRQSIPFHGRTTCEEKMEYLWFSFGKSRYPQYLSPLPVRPQLPGAGWSKEKQTESKGCVGSTGRTYRGTGSHPPDCSRIVIFYDHSTGEREAGGAGRILSPRQGVKSARQGMARMERPADGARTQRYMSKWVDQTRAQLYFINLIRFLVHYQSLLSKRSSSQGGSSPTPGRE